MPVMAAPQSPLAHLMERDCWLFRAYRLDSGGSWIMDSSEPTSLSQIRGHVTQGSVPTVSARFLREDHRVRGLRKPIG
ncbi:hypothetical protein L596_025955 [Steinernema carpocapsae]|uniref:Uncharacterized protein n=1 Tax=Steinernema carpocapsae TaxID=34508 RepID=A0A4U5M9B9_STECR|nr:hypothetical protein L596_025955 [Steinernema carpocapsae]